MLKILFEQNIDLISKKFAKKSGTIMIIIIRVLSDMAITLDELERFSTHANFQHCPQEAF